MQAFPSSLSHKTWGLGTQQCFDCKNAAPRAISRELQSPLAQFLHLRGHETLRNGCETGFRRTVVAAGRRAREDRASSSSSSSSKRRPAGGAAAATGAAGLLPALIQLASGTTIVVGSHHAYVSARWCMGTAYAQRAGCVAAVKCNSSAVAMVLSACSQAHKHMLNAGLLELLLQCHNQLQHSCGKRAYTAAVWA